MSADVSTGHMLAADVELCDETALGNNRGVSSETYWVKPCQLRRQKALAKHQNRVRKRTDHWLTDYKCSIKRMAKSSADGVPQNFII